ncbi:phosphotriesterase [Chloroflexota bacterium]
MSISKIAGKAQTVLGLVYGRDLGVTLVHEHLTIDHVQANFAPPTDLAQKELVDQPLTMDMLHWIQHYRMHNKDNLRLSDEKDIIKEAMFFKNDGGNTIVEMSNMGINRNPKSLAHISRATGLNIIMGSGYYVHTCHPEDMDKKSQDDISQEIVCDVTEGVDDTGIKSGIIGEIGCSWPLHPNEKKVVLAAAKAQRFTGAPINIHPGRGGNAVFELADILATAGADLSRVVMSHIDIRVRNIEEQVQLAKIGCYLEFDNFGWEGPQPADWDPNIDVPSDMQRIRKVMKLIEFGFIKQILFSLDICKKIDLNKYGGRGYNHIQKYVVPMMLRQGMTREQIDTILVDNPRRILCFV